MKTHYELLGIERSADAHTIKTAFRKEIARYHPDKVIHLGPEFQEMAATRAAELTVAYKTLTDKALREAYDAKLAEGAPPPIVEAPKAAPEPSTPPPPIQESPAAEPPPAPPGMGRARFEHERAGRDVILLRAMSGRVRAVVETLYGPLKTPAVRGFDVAFVPAAKPRLLGTALPRVLVKVLDTVDAAAVNDGWSGASRARIHSGKSPVVVLLLVRHMAAAAELHRAFQSLERQRKPADGPHEIAVVVIDTNDWTCHLPPDVSDVVRTLGHALCK